MFELLLPMVLGLGKLIALVVIWTMYKKYIIWGACIVAAYIGVRLLTTVLEFIKMILGNVVLRFVVGAAVLFGGGAVVGYVGHSIPKSEQVREIKIQRPAEHLRSTALIKNGKTYYNQEFVNNLLRLHNVQGVTLKNLA